MKPFTCGWLSVRSMSRSLPCLVTRARMWMSLGAVAVVVEERLALVDAILPAGDDRPHLPLGAVEHGRDGGMGRRGAELGEQLPQPPLADARRADHGREVAAEVARMAHVEHDHLVDVLAPLALLVEHQRRDADAFLEDLGGAGVVGAVRGAADVALMRAVDRPERQPVAVEHGDEGRQIGQVVAAAVGIVQQVDVAGAYPALEELVHGPGRERQRADVDRHVLGLGDQPPVGIAQRGREVAARVQDLRVGGAQHGLAHLLDDGAKAMLDHGDGDRIDGMAHVEVRPREREVRREKRECLELLGSVNVSGDLAATRQPRGMKGRRKAQNSSTAATRRSHSASPIGKLIAIMPRRAM